ncbi:aminomethyltransferase, partial [Aminobacter carboxidus]|nr:aminomethyltransferase [Aminobacter carboxidus]
MTISVYPEIAAGPPRPSLILQPGLLLPGMERYHVPGLGAVLIDIEPGDQLSVRNLEGGQPCELVAFDAAGRADPGILSTRSNSDAAGLKALLVDGDDSLQKLRLGLARRKLELGRVEALRFFDGSTPAGTEESFVAARAGSLVVAAPGAAMAVDGHDTSTPLVVMVKRARVRTAPVGFDLPDPLADPVL